MNIGINYATKKLKKDLTKVINSSKLPVVNVRFVLCELTDEITEIERDAVKKEMNRYEEDVKLEKKKEKSKKEKITKEESTEEAAGEEKDGITEHAENTNRA